MYRYYDVFSTTQRFDTREEMIRWIKEIRIKNEVIVIITRSDTKIGKRDRNNKGILVMINVGNTWIRKVEHKEPLKKCGCPFKIRLTSPKDGSEWKVSLMHLYYFVNYFTTNFESPFISTILTPKSTRILRFDIMASYLALLFEQLPWILNLNFFGISFREMTRIPMLVTCLL